MNAIATIWSTVSPKYIPGAVKYLKPISDHVRIYSYCLDICNQTEIICNLPRFENVPKTQVMNMLINPTIEQPYPSRVSAAYTQRIGPIEILKKKKNMRIDKMMTSD